MRQIFEQLEGRTLMSVSAPVVTIANDPIGTGLLITVDCGSQGQHLIVGKIDADGTRHLLTDADTGADIPVGGVEDAENARWVINGGTGADTVEVVSGVFGSGGLTFNGDQGSDVMTVDATYTGSAPTVFNGGTGNDTAIGDITTVDLGKGN